MNTSPLDNFVLKIAADLGVPGAVQDAISFLRISGMETLLGHPTAHSDVTPGPIPLELSFSQDCDRDLRLLVEPCLPGEGILARTVKGLDAIRDVASELFSSEIARRSYNLACNLLPDGEEIAHLSWRSSVWLALRAADGPSTLRVYVNAQFRDADDRWLRVRSALTACGLNEYVKTFDHMRNRVNSLLKPIGFSFDVRDSGVTPARMHCVTDKISPYWVLRLLNATNLDATIEDCTDFLDLFGLLDHRGECPILVSLGLGKSEVGSLKIDVDLPNLKSYDPASQSQYLSKTEERFGIIPGCHNVNGTLKDRSPRYIGMTFAKNRHHLNVYFPCIFQPQHSEVYNVNAVFDKASVFVQRQLDNTGALLMEARSSSTTPRVVPPKWPDIYMTSLLIQEHSTALNIESDSLERARSYILGVRENSYWRYLPELPYDLDDTAMAWLSLEREVCGIDSLLLDTIMAMANDDGGFPTFIGDQMNRQPSHPAVTLNITYALDRMNIDWPSSGSDQYLKRWIQQPDFPDCEWIGSRLFTIFLFARSSCLVERLGDAVRKQLVSVIARMQRTDGSWGESLPDSLDTALAIISLDLLGAEIPQPEKLKYHMFTFQFNDGGWGWSPFYSDGTGTWFGQRGITTVMAVRALEILDTILQQEVTV